MGVACFARRGSLGEAKSQQASKDSYITFQLTTNRLGFCLFRRGRATTERKEIVANRKKLILGRYKRFAIFYFRYLSKTISVLVCGQSKITNYFNFFKEHYYV